MVTLLISVTNDNKTGVNALLQSITRQIGLNCEADGIGSLQAQSQDEGQIKCRVLTADNHDASAEGATDPGGAVALRAAAVLRRAVHGLQRDIPIIRHLQNGQ